MKQLRNIFITLFTLLNFNGVGVGNTQLDFHGKSQTGQFHQKFYSFSIDKFVEDSNQSEDFDLEEDTDDTDDDFAQSLTVTIVNFSTSHLQNNSFFYSFSLQSVKRFILYCSLKLHC